MVKAKKHVATRTKSSKRGKANAKPARKLAAKQVTPRKAKSKVKRTAVNAKRPAAKKKRPPQPMETAKPIETTPMDVIDEPAPGVVAVTEHESAQIATSISTDVQHQRGEELNPAGTSP
jgi:hypothetical protein